VKEITARRCVKNADKTTSHRKNKFKI